MSDQLFERAVHEWLEDGSDRTPRPAIDAVLLAVKTTPQERDLRIPRRFTLMPTTMRLAAGIAIVALLGVGALLLSNQGPEIGTPTTAPTQPPTTTAVTLTPVVDYSTTPGWIVFEHFGKAPDGSTPAGTEYPRSIWLVHADGSGLHELAPGVPANGKISPDISPDGKKVAFSAWDPPFHLWQVGIEGGTPEALDTGCSGEIEVCTDAFPAYSPDGGRIAFVRNTAESSAIGILDLASGEVKILGQTLTTSLEEQLAEPSWSPDGSRIVYHQVGHDPVDDKVTGSTIFIALANDGRASALNLGITDPVGDADWSPDGSRIVFSSYPIHEYNSELAKVMTARPDGTDLKTFREDGAATWTPDGQHIMFWGPTTFYMMEADGTNARMINTAGGLNFFGNSLGYGYYSWLQPTR
jgi:dipeptidyl aminopeptidase/acylaminoacyl peptidase